MKQIEEIPQTVTVCPDFMNLMKKNVLNVHIIVKNALLLKIAKYVVTIEEHQQNANARMVFMMLKEKKNAFHVRLNVEYVK